MTEDESEIKKIKNKIYLLYNSIKDHLIPKISEENNNITSSDNINIIINSLKNGINIVIETIKELENNIIKLEKDLRYHIKNGFILKIQKDSADMKIRSLMEMEEEFEELKEKVRYEGGKFLNNDRKDNEIKILRRENSNLKKAIKKMEKRELNDKEIISFLKLDISNNNKKIENLEKEIENLKNQIKYKELNEIEENNNKISKININNNKIGKRLKRNLTNYQLGLNPITNYESLKNKNQSNNSNKLIILTFDKMNNNQKNKNMLKPLRNLKLKEENKHNKNSSISMRADDKKFYLPNNINKYFANTKIRGLSKINQKIKYNIQNLNNNNKNIFHEYNEFNNNIINNNKEF